MTAGATKVKAPTAEGAVVFTDLTGFSEFTAIRGDEAALEMLTLQERLLREAMDARGRIVGRARLHGGHRSVVREHF